MIQSLHTPSLPKNKPDCLIVGAGVFGLWAARHAIKRGERVVVVDKAAAGSGASGGFLGSLMPHQPVRWNAKKQMQFEALSSLGDVVRELEADTGLDCGYRRCGRLIPLTHGEMPEHAAERIDATIERWQGRFTMTKLELPFAGSQADGWLSENVSPFGATYDNLSACINPRKYMAALAAYVRGHGTLLEGTKVTGIDPDGCEVKLADGSRIAAGRIVIANGYEAYALLEKIDARYKSQMISGRGVKGQAVLLDFTHDDTLPIVYDQGAYIVPHAGNRVAIGSTSVNDWQRTAHPRSDEFDANDMDFYEHAMKLVPTLKDAPIIERWAGVRPRNTVADLVSGKVGSEAIVGSLDGYPLVSVAIGGFKIGLGIGHLPN